MSYMRNGVLVTLALLLSETVKAEQISPTIQPVDQTASAGRQLPSTQSFPKETTIVARACLGLKGKYINRTKLAEAILQESGYSPSDLLGADTAASSYSSVILNKMNLVSTGETRIDADFRVRLTIEKVERSLASNSLDGLSFEGTPDSTLNWLFSASPVAWKLKCKAGDKPIDTYLGSYESLPNRTRFSFREKPEELALTGDERKQAGAFAVGLERVWSVKDDGSKLRKTTLSVNGTVGFRLIGGSGTANVYSFARYNLKKVRNKPATPLAAGERREADDTNVLALGLAYDFYSDLGDTPLWITGESSFLSDYADKSRRLRFRAAIEPGIRADLGICNLGTAKFDVSNKFGVRCLLRLDVDSGVWLKNGLSTKKSYDDFLAIGPNGSLEAFYKTGPKTELIGTVSYRYLPILTGTLEDIKRFDVSIKQRFWMAIGAGVDIGFSYSNGTNALTLEDEKSLTAGLGFIF